MKFSSIPPYESSHTPWGSIDPQFRIPDLTILFLYKYLFSFFSVRSGSSVIQKAVTWNEEGQHGKLLVTGFTLLLKSKCY
jgi:hypothetical protein